MPKRYDLLVFDWDGTLMDSTASIVRAIQLAFRDMDKPVPSDDKARHVIGLGLADAMRYLDPGLDADDVRQVVDCYRHYYLSRDHEIELFAGVREVAARLPEDAAFDNGDSEADLDPELVDEVAEA